MFYKYKVTEFTGENYYYDSKEELFCLIDLFGYHSFLRNFTNQFDIGCGAIHHSTKKIMVDGEYIAEDNYYHKYFNYQETYRSGNFIIRTVSGATVNIRELAYDYAKSRDLLKKSKPKIVYNSWAKQIDRPYACKPLSGVKHELRQMLDDIKDGLVKVRRKRLNDVKSDYFYEGQSISGHAQNWKKQKKKKQWM